jgi:hypothetical protein
VDVSSCKRWILTLQSRGLVCYTDRSRFVGCVEQVLCVCGGVGGGGGRSGKRLIFPIGVHATVLQEEFFVIFFCAKKYTRRACEGKHIYVCSDSQAALWVVRLWVTLKLVWKFWQTVCILSSKKKFTGPDHSGIQSKEDVIPRLGKIEEPFSQSQTSSFIFTVCW